MASVQINYKSGQSVVVKCKDFTINSPGGSITHLEWEDAKPRPLHIGIGEIESVWQL